MGMSPGRFDQYMYPFYEKDRKFLERVRLAYLQLAEQLETSGYLDRKLESFPQEKELNPL